MTERTGEEISAFLDGQLPADQAKRVLDGMLAEDAQIDQLGRYRLIGDAMRGECAVVATDTVNRIRTQLADEPTILAPRTSRPSWSRMAAGMALAASVAAVAIVVAPGMLGNAPGGADIVVAERSETRSLDPALPPALQVATRATSPSLPVASSEDALQRRLNRLVIEHQEFGGRSGLYGPVPHIGLVSYDR